MNDAVPSDDGQGLMRQTILAALLLPPLLGLPAAYAPRPARPNILIALADDLSHVHTSMSSA